jgi:hypothetical protein
MKANRSGRIAEDFIASLLVSVGIAFKRQVVVGRTIYDTELRVDFLVGNLREFPRGLVIESKWQDVSGSADEKFPYLVANIQQSNLPTIVIVHGGGCRPGALAWLYDRRDGVHLVEVYGLEGFISWVHRADKVHPVSNNLPFTPAASTAAPRRE